MGRRFSTSAYPHLRANWIVDDGVEVDDPSVRATNHYRWTCSHGHPPYTTTFGNRAYYGSGCPLCAAVRRSITQKGVPKPVRAGHSLVERNPVLRSLFDEEKNGRPIDGIGPANSFWWWKCDRGHQWKASAKILMDSIDSGNTGCRACYLRIRTEPRPGRSLGDLHPGLVVMWHPSKNGNLTPFDVRPNCNDYAYWVCERGHETSAIINSRSSGFGCTHCVPFKKSQIGEMFRGLFAASFFLTAVTDTAHRMAVNWSNRQNRRWMTVDIFGVLRRQPNVCVVIEYDGSYYHKGDASRAREIAKTQALLDSGHIVVRIRENAIAHVAITHPLLFQVDHAYRFKDSTEALVPTMDLIEAWLADLDVGEVITDPERAQWSLPTTTA